MATFNTTLYTAQDEDRLNTARLPAPNQAGGASAYGDGALCARGHRGRKAPSDTIKLCVLPAGAIPGPRTFVRGLRSPAGDGADVWTSVMQSNPDALADGIS